MIYYFEIEKTCFLFGLVGILDYILIVLLGRGATLRLDGFMFYLSELIFLCLLKKIELKGYFILFYFTLFYFT